MLSGQRAHELELRRVRVLILVHHHVAILCAAGGEGAGMVLKQPQDQKDEIIEIERIAGAQGGLVT